MAARLKEAGPFVDEIDRMIYPTLNHSYHHIYHHVYFMLDNIIGNNGPSPTITNTYVDKMATFPKLSPYLSSQRHTVGCAQGPMQNHKKSKQFLLFSCITRQEFWVRHGGFVLTDNIDRKYAQMGMSQNLGTLMNAEKHRKKPDETHPNANSNSRVGSQLFICDK